VRSASGPVGHHRLRLAEFPPADPQAFRRLLLENPLDRAAGFVTATGNEVSILLELERNLGARQEALLAELERQIAAAPPGVVATMVGETMFQRALNASGREVERVYFPLLLVLAAFLLAATFREVGAVVLPLAFVATVEIVVLGAMGYAGVKVNLVVAILPPILFVIALASAVHLMLRCRDIEADPASGGSEAASAHASAAPEGDGSAAVLATLATYRDKGRALFWTTISTLAGFASLAVTPVAPIRTLGLWAGLGLAFSGVAAFTLLPCLLARTMGRRTRLPERALELRLQGLGRRVTELAADHRSWVLAIYAGLALVAAAGLPRLSVASNALHYLAPEHPVRAGIESVERLGIGLSALELVATVASGAPVAAAAAVAPSDGPDFLSAPRLDQLAGLAAALRGLPGIHSVVGATDLLDDVARASPLAAAFTPAELRPRLLPLVRADETGKRALERFLAADGSVTRLTLFVPTEGYAHADPLAERALALARQALPGATVEITGQYPLLLAMQRYLLSTLALSLLLTLPVLALTFYILLRDLQGAFFALVPNLWPVLLILGGMGWFGVPLDIATVMVASITLGLVVDDTIHTLAHYRELRAELGSRAAVADRMEKTAPAYLLTGVILACGFGVCALSGFAPTAHFGLLSAIAIVIAVIADFTLVPALFGRSSD
jgi:predicted RND superfamily exporter protein